MSRKPFKAAFVEDAWVTHDSQRAPIHPHKGQPIPRPRRAGSRSSVVKVTRADGSTSYLSATGQPLNRVTRKATTVRAHTPLRMTLPTIHQSDDI